MVLALSLAREFAGLVDTDRGLVDRRIFHDATTYQLELEQIFACAEFVDDELGPQRIENHVNEYAQRWTYRT